MPLDSKHLIEIQDATKIYGAGDSLIFALRNLSLNIVAGEYVAIMGPSGSGKSTLMNVLGALDGLTSGSYKLDGIEISKLDETGQSIVRSKKIGFIFQSFNLIPRTSALANVELPLAYQGVKAVERRERAIAALKLVGLESRINHEPNELSGGQQQRVAVARALVTRPSILLADEPTGALDSKSTEELLNLFGQINSAGRTVIVITHENDVANRAKRIIRMKDGEIVSDAINSKFETFSGVSA